MKTRAAAPTGRAPRERSVPAAMLALVRWPNAIIAGVGVLLGAWWVWSTRTSAEPLAFRPVILATVGVLFATFGVNAINDAVDVDIDRVAHPERPLPRDELSPSIALRVGIAASVLAFALGCAANAAVGILLTGGLLAAWAYAFDFNRRLLFGNALVAVVASLPFVVGAAAAGAAGQGLALFAVAVPLHFAREVMKDLADTCGDRGRRRTVALVSGPRAARGLALASVLAYAALASFFFAPAGRRWVALMPSAVIAAWATLRADIHRAPLVLKLAMLFAMAALPFLR